MLRHHVVVAWVSPVNKKNYKALFHELSMPNDNNVDVDVPTR